MKKKVWVLLLALALASGLTACGGTNLSDEATEEEMDYVSSEEIPDVFSDPDAYAGRYIVLTGQISKTIDSEETQEQQAFQAYFDTQAYTGDYVVYCSREIPVTENEYIAVEGKIVGAEPFETLFGEQRNILTIEAVSVTEKSYIDIVTPAIAVVMPQDATASQHDISVTVDKVEFAEDETRIWITMQNDSDKAVDIYPKNSLLLQDGAQYAYNWDSMTLYETDETEPADRLLGGITSSGLLVFPAINIEEESQLYMEKFYSDDYEEEFDPFIITIPSAH